MPAMGADAEAEAAAAITAAVTTSSVRRRPTKLEKAAWQTWRCDCAASAAAALASRADAALLQHSRVGDPSRSAGRHSLVPSAAASSSPHPPPKPALAALFFRSLSPSQTTKVVIHPIVLLSVVDHYNRVAKDTKKRVVGMLLGQVSKGVVDVLNCYAVPFEEDERDLKIWFLDHNYHEQMYAMYRKVNASEKLIGWYSTGPKIRPGDMQIDQLVRRYVPNPVMVIVDVKPKTLGIPTEAYQAVEEIREGQQQQWTFQHVPSEIGASESEEVGVEHLLRDVKDMTLSTLSNRVTQKLGALKGLVARLTEVDAYLRNVLEGRMPVNHRVIYNLQDIFNLLPNLNVDELIKAFAVKTNDMTLAIYLGSIIRSVIALHNLIDNRLANKEKERAADEAKEKKDNGEEKKEEDKGKENEDKKEDKGSKK